MDLNHQSCKAARPADAQAGQIIPFVEWINLDAVCWAKKQRIGDPLAAALLRTIAGHAAKTNWQCQIRRRTLATEMEASVKTIQRKLKILIDRGLITVTERTAPNGARLASLYALTAEIQTENQATPQGHGVPPPGTGGPTLKEKDLLKKNSLSVVRESSREAANQQVPDATPEPTAPPERVDSRTADPVDVVKKFAEFWAASRHRDDEPQAPARKEFAKAIREGADADMLIAARAKCDAADRARNPGTTQFAPFGERWLREKRWQGYAAELAAHAAIAAINPKEARRLQVCAEMRAAGHI
jgi:Helix-turn-helix domain